jgi:16S rRNA (guanine527-N7)-methyltransferase
MNSPGQVASDTAAAVDELVREARTIGLAIGMHQARQFATYIETLLLWRARLSLTSADTAMAIVRDHILDSLHLWRFVELGSQVADIGSGAGFPGMPLAIACAEAQFTLIESRRKRANFLREAIRQAGVSNARVVEGRAESPAVATGPSHDVVTARALGSIAEFLKISAPLIKPGGLAIAMKGPKGIEETRDRGDGFGEAEVVRYQPQPGVHHLLLVYRRS